VGVIQPDNEVGEILARRAGQEVGDFQPEALVLDVGKDARPSTSAIFGPD